MVTLAHKKFKILLIGDNCIDTYVYGSITRLSPEAPVPIFEPIHEIVKNGMAGNVANNLESLNCEVTFIHSENCEKKRLIDKKTKQHLLRIDNDVSCKSIEKSHIDKHTLYEYDALIISDYNKGTVTSSMVEWLRQEYQGPIFIDTKKTDLNKFNGCFIKINQLERSLAKTLPDSQYLIVTLGEQGVEYMENIIRTDNSNSVVDVCGAGDTFLSALVYQYLNTKDIHKSIIFANKAAGITVKHVGVYAPTLEEIEA